MHVPVLRGLHDYACTRLEETHEVLFYKTDLVWKIDDFATEMKTPADVVARN